MATTDARKRILFVDDEPSLAEVCRKVLERDGYLVSVFADPSEALSALWNSPTPFDLVISDVEMPTLNGLAFVRTLHAVHPRTPVILATGGMQTLTLEEERDLGICGYLQKPYSLGMLREFVARTVA